MSNNLFVKDTYNYMLNKKLFYLFYSKANNQNLNIVNIKIIGFEEVKEKSSHYGLYMLGFTCATRAETKSSNN